MYVKLFFIICFIISDNTNTTNSNNNNNNADTLLAIIMNNNNNNNITTINTDHLMFGTCITVELYSINNNNPTTKLEPNSWTCSPFRTSWLDLLTGNVILDQNEDTETFQIESLEPINTQEFCLKVCFGRERKLHLHVQLFFKNNMFFLLAYIFWRTRLGYA